MESVVLKALYHTFGCKLNFAETSTIADMLARHGIGRAENGETPDFVIVNTCSVTEEADKKCRQSIRAYHRRFPQAAIVVTGCYAQLKAAEAAALDGVVVVAGNDQKDRIAAFIDSWKSRSRVVSSVSPLQQLTRFVASCSRGDRTRYFLKVQDGCDYWCTYCTIPRARGRSRSPRVGELVARARDVAAQGGKEIVLTGVNIGDFGKPHGVETFFDLVKALDEVDGIERYRISSIEPNLLTDEIIDFVAGSRRFMPHFHIPLQSGSDAVLALMRRHYDTALFRHKIERVRQAMPDAFIGVDLIVGARGETDDEFVRSRDFVDSLDISRLHVFPYSERPETKALMIDGAVSQADKHRRAAEMIALSDTKLRRFSERFVGSRRPVLLEHPKPSLPMTGFTDNYLKVRVDARPELDNTIVAVALDSLDLENEEIIGRIVDER